MVQIQRNTSSWRSSDDLTDMDFSQAAAELLGSNLDLSDDMALIGMDNLFDDVDAVITEDRDIFMGFTEDTQLKNDIFMNCDTNQGTLCYNELSPELSPEAVAYDDVTSPLHSSSDESQDQASYSGGLTPDSDIMDSDMMDTEEQVCDESVIPLVALEITGAISPLKDTKRPTRRKATTKAGGVRKRRSPVKRPTKTVRARDGRKKQTEPDVQCVKVCPPTSEKCNTFSPSTLFPTIMSALRTNTSNAVPLERLVKPKTIDTVSPTNPDIAGIQTPPTTPVELKPSIMTGSPLHDCLAKHEAQDLHSDVKPSPKVSESDSVAQVMPPVNDSEVKDTAKISVKSEAVYEQVNTQTQDESSEMKDSEIEVVLDSVVEMSTQSDSPSVQNEEKALKETKSQNDQQGVTKTSPKPRLKLGVRVPSPTRMTTRGITRRRPSLVLKTKNGPRSPKTGQNLPSKIVSQTVETSVDQTIVPQKEAVVSASVQCTSSITTGQCKTPVSSEALSPPLQTRTMTVTNCMPCSKTLPLAKGTSVTVVSSTARLGQPSVTAHPPAQAEHLPLPAKITAVPLTAIPARSTILGILPSSARIRPAVAQSVPFKLQTVTAPAQQLQTVTAPAQLQTVTAPAQQLQTVTVPAQLQTTPTAALPGATPVRLKPQPSAFVSQPPTPAVSTILPASAVVLPTPIASAVQSVPPAQLPNVPTSLPQVMPVSIKQELDSDSNDTEEKEASVASRNTEILNLLNKQTNLSCVKMEEDSLPRSYSGYSSSSSSSSSGSPAPPQSPTYCSAPTPAVVSIKEEMLSDYSDIEDDYERFKNLSPEEQARVRRRRLNNRVAAQRCRQRKRDHFQGLKKEIQEWECSNTQLRYEIHVLQKELKSLAKVWNDHTTQCATAMAMTKRKHKKYKKSHRTTSASSSSSCSHSTAAAAASSTATSDPSPAPVPIVVN